MAYIDRPLSRCANASNVWSGRPYSVAMQIKNTGQATSKLPYTRLSHTVIHVRLPVPAGHTGTDSINRMKEYRYAPETSSLRQHVDKTVARRRLSCVDSALPTVKEYPTITGSARKVVSSMKPPGIYQSNLHLYHRALHIHSDLCANQQAAGRQFLRCHAVLPREVA